MIFLHGESIPVSRQNRMELGSVRSSHVARASGKSSVEMTGTGAYKAER